MANEIQETDIKSWLSVALAKENLENIDVKITGVTEQGSGFVGDVIFVTLMGIKSGKNVEYDLVLKCSKSNEAFKNQMREAYLQESYMYDKIFPAFRQFEESKNIQKPFDSIPKCYGIYNSNSKHVLVLDNLKKTGYDLWNAKLPLTRRHIDLVIQKYAHFHAISVALREQFPQKFDKLKSELQMNVMKKILKDMDFVKLVEKTVEDIYDLLQNDLSSKSLNKFLNLKNKLEYICYEMKPDNEDLTVIVHGDCWSNNFMYKHENGDLTKPGVKILDWQVSDLTSPVIDISYFVFACIAPEDVPQMNDILKHYYNNFSYYLSELGSQFITNYPFETFINDWKKFGKFGLMMSLLPVKMSYIEKENIPDMTELLEKEIFIVFNVETNKIEEFKKRIKPIVKYVVENNII